MQEIEEQKIILVEDDQGICYAAGISSEQTRPLTCWKIPFSQHFCRGLLLRREVVF